MLVLEYTSTDTRCAIGLIKIGNQEDANQVVFLRTLLAEMGVDASEP